MAVEREIAMNHGQKIGFRARTFRLDAADRPHHARGPSEKRTEGLSTILVDLRQAVGHGLKIRPIRTMMNHATTEIVFRQSGSPVENWSRGRAGVRYLLDSLNAERILSPRKHRRLPLVPGARLPLCDMSESFWAGRSAKNQGIQFPIARAHATWGGTPDGISRSSLLIAAKRAARGEYFQASCSGRFLGIGKCRGANVRRFRLCGRVRHRTQIPRNPGYIKWRPISTNLILSYLAEHVLGLPASY